jgi:HK97 family phage portal protein
MESAVMSQLLWGNVYLFPRRDRAGRVVELWPIDPDRVEAADTFETPGGAIGVRFRVSDMGELDNVPGQPVALIHVPHMTLPGRVLGVSPIEQLAELVGMSLSSQEHAARFLGEGVHMAGVIESPGNLDGAKARELQQSFRMMYGGPKNSGRVGVLTGGASFHQLTIPPAELQFLEQMKYSDQKIASLYRVPPHMVGDITNSTSWGSGIEEQTIQFVQHTLLPIIRKLEESFERSLLADTGYEMRFQVNGLLRGNIAARSAFYSALWNIGALSDDDIRAFEDLPPIPDGAGSTYYVPLNMTPAGQAADEQRNALIDALRGGR